jgi:N-acetyl-gamma-glutamyl-phosphate reductase
MIKVGILGATGYTGVELCRILQSHPQAQVLFAGTESYVDRDLAQVYPHLQNLLSLKGVKLDAASMAEHCDVIFTALPHGLAMQHAQPILDAGKKLIDLGADFRIKSAATFAEWYKHSPAPSHLLEASVYGLPEAGFREQIKNANLIANPGCYPTSCTLAAIPALRAGIVEPKGIIFDSKSGTTGAGRSLSLAMHASEVHENFKTYNVAGKHRHIPEIEQVLHQTTGLSSPIQFTPHLLPIARGMLTTAYFTLSKSISAQQAHQLYVDHYENEPFVRVQPLGTMPQCKQVRGSNYCDIGIDVDNRTSQLIVVSVIDNLVKGAAGQAVQNMNLTFGLPETSGLHTLVPLYP